MPGIPFAVGVPSKNTNLGAFFLLARDFSNVFSFFQTSKTSSSSLGKSGFISSKLSLLPLIFNQKKKPSQGFDALDGPICEGFGYNSLRSAHKLEDFLGNVVFFCLVVTACAHEFLAVLVVVRDGYDWTLEGLPHLADQSHGVGLVARHTGIHEDDGEIRVSFKYGFCLFHGEGLDHQNFVTETSANETGPFLVVLYDKNLLQGSFFKPLDHLRGDTRKVLVKHPHPKFLLCCDVVVVQGLFLLSLNFWLCPAAVATELAHTQVHPIPMYGTAFVPMLAFLGAGIAVAPLTLNPGDYGLMAHPTRADGELCEVLSIPDVIADEDEPAAPIVERVAHLTHYLLAFLGCGE